MRRRADGRCFASWYTEVDGERKRKWKSFKGPDAAALARAYELEQREIDRLIRAGKLTRSQLSAAQASRIPLATLADEYVEHLAERGTTDKHRREWRRLIDKFAGWCRETTIGAIRTDHILGYMRELPAVLRKARNGQARSWPKDAGRSARNSNVHIGAVKALFAFARRRRYITEDPTEFVELTPEPMGGEDLNVARPFTRQELGKLLACERVIETGRGLYYRARLLTLMRGTELSKVLRSDLKHQGEIAYIDARADIAKTGQPRLVPVAPDLATDLMCQAIRVGEKDRIFPTTVTRITWLADLERAGLAHQTGDGKLVGRSFRLTGSIWLREINCPLADEMLISGGTGRGAAKTRVWHYHDLQRELPRLHGRVCKLANYVQAKSAKEKMG